MPASWDGVEVFLQFGGVSSAFYVWINGEYVGYSEGSKTASEFRVTNKLTTGTNSIAVEVYRWSTGSYLEDQDFWSLSGIQRDVILTARPRVRLRDYFVHSELSDDYTNGDFSIELSLVNDNSNSMPTGSSLSSNSSYQTKKRSPIDSISPALVPSAKRFSSDSKSSAY